MKLTKVILGMTMILALGGCGKSAQTSSTDEMVLVKGGTFKNANSSYYGKDVKVDDFYIGKCEVSQEEWQELMGGNPSQFNSPKLPVETVSWYDCVEFCNKKSEKEGLTPYYTIDKEHQDPQNICEYDEDKWTVTENKDANGYRLPYEMEWEYAASGGQESKNYKYSGSNKEDDVMWYWRNSGKDPLEGDWNWPHIEANHNRTKEIASKKPNELGLYDMSGNIREWCNEWYEDENFPLGGYRVWRGGGWMGENISCEITYRGKYEPCGRGSDSGFRLCRNAN